MSPAHAPIAARPLPAPTSGLYIAVLAAAGYDRLAGLCGDGVQFAGTAAGLVALFGLDVLERRRFGTTARKAEVGPSAIARVLPARLLPARLLLVELIVVLDCSGTATLLRVLVVFAAHFALGPRGARTIAAIYATGLLVRITLTVPVWWRDPHRVSNLLMSAAGLVFALVAATVMAQLDESRASAERLVADLEESRVLLREHAARAVEAAAVEERNQVARDIHDGLGHHLTAVSVQLQKASLYIDREPSVARAAVDDAQDAARQALADVRRSVRTLREADTFELRAALGALARQSADTVPRVRLQIEGNEHGFDPAVLLTAYRVAQEALTNVHRHAEAVRADVRVMLDPDVGAQILVTDDGRGFDLPAPSDVTGDGPRLGLRGMRERVELLGGRLVLDSGPGRGTSVRAWLPVRASAQAVAHHSQITRMRPP